MGMKKYKALVSKVFYFLLSATNLSMLGVLGFISSTIPLPKNNTIFSMAYDLVVMARSTKMLVFILCHIIIVIISYGSSSKPPFESELDSDGVLVVTPNLHLLRKIEEVVYGDKGDDKSVSEIRGDEEEDDVNGVSYDADDESFDTEDCDEEEEESHGDLRGRIEEFIGSVTRKWKEELLKEKKLLCKVEDSESLYMLVPHEMV